MFSKRAIVSHRQKAHGYRNPLHCKVVGSICMDQMMVDIGWDEAYNGEEVVLLGEQGEQKISVCEHARWSGTINYEIICAINSRVPRVPV